MEKTGTLGGRLGALPPVGKKWAGEGEEKAELRWQEEREVAPTNLLHLRRKASASTFGKVKKHQQEC